MVHPQRQQGSLPELGQDLTETAGVARVGAGYVLFRHKHFVRRRLVGHTLEWVHGYGVTW